MKHKSLLIIAAMAIMLGGCKEAPTRAGEALAQEFYKAWGDTAALKQVVPYIRPKVIVVTNLFTDQADRFGSVENTLAEIRKGIKRSPGSVLVLNAEDTQSASLALDVPNKVVWYGLNESVGEQGKTDLSDAGKCPKCGSEYEYDYHVYAHLAPYAGCRRHLH